MAERWLWVNIYGGTHTVNLGELPLSDVLEQLTNTKDGTREYELVLDLPALKVMRATFTDSLHIYVKTDG